MSACPQCGTANETDAFFCQSCGLNLKDDTARIEDPFLGRVLEGKFRVDKLIGTGGMSRVYAATQLNLNKRVCVKVMHAELLKDESHIRRFRREADAVSRLNHPHIVQVTDFGQDPETGSPYLAMEFVPGKDLAAVLRGEYPLGQERIVHIMSQVLSALANAHRAGIVHRDLKPANIIISDLPGTRDFVKVLDFGIAKLLDPPSGETGLTQAGLVCGTPEYMAPEQARGEPIDARCDIYAAGVMLYRLVANRLPFEADTPMGLISRHLTEKPTPPGRLQGVSVSTGLEAVIMTALRKSPKDRQPSALFMQEQLSALASEPAAGQRPAITQTLQPVMRGIDWFKDWAAVRWRRMSNRNRWLAVGLLCGIGLLILIGVVFSDPLSSVRSMIASGQIQRAARKLDQLEERKTPEGRALRAETLLLAKNPDLDSGTKLLHQAIGQQPGLLGDSQVRRALLKTLDQRHAEKALDFVVKQAGQMMTDDLIWAATHKRYWMRWHSVNALKQLGQLDRIDKVDLYIADLRFAGSCSTRKKAAQQLAKLKDARALEPLRQAKKRNFFDNLCMGDALEDAIRAIQ